MSMRHYVLASFCCLFFISTAQAMRCGDKLINEGASRFNVLSACGEPLAKENYEQTVPLYNQQGYQIGVNTVIIEAWIYQKSSADFKYELIFDGGVVKQITVNRNP